MTAQIIFVRRQWHKASEEKPTAEIKRKRGVTGRFLPVKEGLGVSPQREENLYLVFPKNTNTKYIFCDYFTEFCCATCIGFTKKTLSRAKFRLKSLQNLD